MDLKSVAFILVSVVVVALLGQVVTLTGRVRQHPVPVEIHSSLTADHVVAGVTAEKVGSHIEVMSQWRTRMAGTVGHEATAAHIRKTFDALDMDVYEQPVMLTVPVLEYCELLDESGSPIEGVELYPFWPNLVRTCTIAEPGLDAVVKRGKDGGSYIYEFDGARPSETVPLVPVSTAEHWVGLADAGFPAVIFYRNESARPRHYLLKELNFCADFPRFFLDGDPSVIDGRRVRIRCRVDWREVESAQIFGVIEPEGGHGGSPVSDAEDAAEHERQAIIVTAHYDSIGAVPDLAPGGEEAGAVAVLLTAAEFAADHRDHLQRTMVFAALTGRGQASRGVRELAALWGPPGDEQVRAEQLAAGVKRKRRRLELIEGSRQVLDDPAYWRIVGDEKAAAEQGYWQGQAVGLEEALLEDVRRVIEAEIEGAQEQLIELDLVRARSSQASGGDADTAVQSAYEAASENVNALRTAATATLLDLKTHYRLDEDQQRRGKLVGRLAARESRLRQDIERAEKSQQVQRLLHGFDRHMVFCLANTSGAPGSALLGNYPDSRRSMEGARGWIGEIAAQLYNDTLPLVPQLVELDMPRRAAEVEARRLLVDGVNAGGDYTPQRELDGGSMYYPYLYFYEFVPLLGEGRHAMAWVTYEDAARSIGTPEDTFDRLEIDYLFKQARVVTAALTRMGAGHVALNAKPHLPRTKRPRGKVLQAADPNSVIPTRGVPGVLVVARARFPIRLGSVRQQDIVMTDEDGDFLFPPFDSLRPPEDFPAFRIDPESGDVIAVKDMGEKGEASFPTARTWNNLDNPLRIVLFRCAQTDIYYPLHPSRGVALGSAFAVDWRTLTAAQSYAVLSGNPFGTNPVISWDYDVPNQGFSLYNPPAMRFYVGLRSASPLDPTMEAVVAYMLGDRPPADQPPAGREIWGRGYIAADTPRISLWMQHASSSMKVIDGYRLARQQKHRVADPIQIEQHGHASAASDRASEQLAAGRQSDALRSAQDSLAVSMEVYPRIGQVERDAVIGVLFYLFMVVPFAVFMERLLFGFPDIRAQIAGVVGIFTVVFIALRFLHPAFELVSSGMMVLVGFLTLSLSLFVTMFLFGKFQQNIKQLRLQLQRTAEAADVSRVAAAGTAFLLGINNMRKRKVRTLFTCLTLVLVTFALLSLTAVGHQSQFKQIAIGRAPYTGLLIMGRNATPLSGTASLLERFGHRFPVSRLFWLRGSRGLTRGGRGQAGTEQYPIHWFSGEVAMDPSEVEVTKVAQAVVAGRFFLDASERSCMLPAGRALQMGFTHEQVDRGEAEVYVDGTLRKIVGLFDPGRLESALDLNGESLMPTDKSALNQAQDEDVLPEQITAPPDLPRIPADQIVLLPIEEVQWGSTARVAVNMNNVPPAEAMAAIKDFLQRWEGDVYYGIGGLSYFGRFFRGTQVKGLAEIAVPLLIAAAIVLNTMLGSVYERTQEIGIYSAVGLSPTHVHYLFLAEACVYATVGTVAGYLLAHGVGTVLAALNMTSGLSFNYSSVSVVYASVALIVAVLLSTLYPARKAAKLASPSQRTTAEVPQPQDDKMMIPLPFTYVELDAISVIPYLSDVLEDHGQGSSGDFYCQSPDLVDYGESDGAEAAQGGFGLRARCWLKPYDLGVSQMMTLSVRPTEHENVWAAQLHLERVSGGVEAWRRANKLFLTVLRKHFLAWRGLEDPQKDEYLVRGLAALKVPLERYVGG